jgi:hypothetical protein
MVEVVVNEAEKLKLEKEKDFTKITLKGEKR